CAGDGRRPPLAVGFTLPVCQGAEQLESARDPVVDTGGHIPALAARVVDEAVARRAVDVDAVIQPLYGRAAARPESGAHRIERTIRNIRVVFNRPAMWPLC